MTAVDVKRKATRWVGEFTANSSFAVEVKLTKAGNVSLYQKFGDGSEYAPVKGSLENCEFYSKQFDGKIFPINIRVECNSEPVYIKYQEEE